MDENRTGLALGIPEFEGSDPLSIFLRYSLYSGNAADDHPEVSKNCGDIISIAFRVGAKATSFSKDVLDTLISGDIQKDDERKIADAAEFFRLMECELDNFIQTLQNKEE